jgi:hypothetical protein
MASLQSILKAAKVVEQAATEARPLEEAVKAKRMSKAESEAAGLYHPVGMGVKLKKPIDEMKFETIPDPRFDPVPVKKMTPEDLYGKVGIPLLGDRAEAGKILKSVEGQEVDVPLEGGRYYMRSHTYPKQPEKSAAWSSDKAPTSKLSKAIQRGAETGKDVMGINILGSHTNVDFNTMLSSTFAQRFDPSAVKKSTIKEFNKEVQDKFPDFLGIDHPELLDQLNTPGKGNLRKYFIDRAAQAKYQNSGFPDMASSVKAVTDPELLDLPTGSSGLAIARMDPEGRIITDPLHEHGTYKFPLAGEYAGELEIPLDFRDIFQSSTDARRLFSLPVQSDLRSLSFQSPAVQEFNQEWLDRVMPIYQKKMKEITGKAKGGEVDLEEEYRKANILEKKPEEGGAKIMERPNPYGLRAFETDTGYGGEMMPKTAGWAGEIPSLAKEGQVLTEVSLGGENGEPFYPMVFEGITPEQIEIVQDYEAGLREDDDPAVMAMKQLAKNKALTRMHMHQSPFKDVKMAKGGKVGALEKIIKTAVDISKETKLPPPENAARTQVANTKGTYDKARELLKLQGVDKNIIDYGAGKGIGSYGWADTYEPYAKGWYPTYTKAEDIPSDMYSGLLNLNVLNVLPPELRAEAIENMGRVLEKGGKGVVTTRGKDVMSGLAGGRPGPEPMSVITSWDTYQKGFTGQELEDELRRILGTGFDVNKLNLGPAGAKIQKKADGGVMDSAASQLASTWEGYSKSANLLKELATKYYEGLGEDVSNLDWNAIRDIPSNIGADILGLPGDLAKAAFPYGTGVYAKGIEDQPSKLGSRRIKDELKDVGITSGKDYPFIEGTAEVFPGTTIKAVKSIPTFGKALAKEGARQIQTGEGLIGRNVINPRQNIIKDPGGMVVGGEKELDIQLAKMKKEEGYGGLGAWGDMALNAQDKDPHAVAINNWIDTKVRKYIRNQAGTEADPILKAIESGVEHNFQPRLGDNKYLTVNKRKMVGKPEEGIAKTDLGKEWEFTVDSIFKPTKAKEVKELLDNPNISEIRKQSMLRMEHDLPIHSPEDYEAIKLVNQIPDENLYTITGDNVGRKFGLDHVADVLLEDLRAGKLTQQQMEQMSVEKAVRRAAEYDAQKAKEMAKANASSVEGMPVSREYSDGFKWVELKHGSDSKKTAEALKSEGQMMGHCVGNYCPEVERGEIKIYSLRSPDGKSHVTIEARPQYNATQWKEANDDLIKSDPYLSEIEPNIAHGDIDAKYGYNPSTDSDYIRIMEKEMRKKGIEPIEPEGYMELHQVKGKQNKRPDEKYQSYISDFIKNNPTKHEIADIHELENTNLMNVNEVSYSGMVPKDVHFHPEVEKAVAIKYPHLQGKFEEHGWSDEIGDAKYDLFKEASHDLAKQNKFYFTKDDLLNHIREKYLTQPKKKSGGSVTKYDLEKEFKLNNIIEIPRRKHG